MGCLFFGVFIFQEIGFMLPIMKLKYLYFHFSSVDHIPEALL